MSFPRDCYGREVKTLGRHEPQNGLASLEVYQTCDDNVGCGPADRIEMS